MGQSLKFLLLFLTITMVGGCDKADDETSISFIGDSLISRWDLEYDFPVYSTQNFGLAGSGMKWLEQNRKKLNGQTAVVLTGTNDLKNLDEASLDYYAFQYVDAVIDLEASKVIVISILPRNSKNDSHDINLLIAKLNWLIAGKVENEENIIYCNVYSEFIKNGTLNMNLSYDGIHLNQYGYEILASKIKSHL